MEVLGHQLLRRRRRRRRWIPRSSSRRRWFHPRLMLEVRSPLSLEVWVAHLVKPDIGRIAARYHSVLLLPYSQRRPLELRSTSSNGRLSPFEVLVVSSLGAERGGYLSHTHMGIACSRDWPVKGQETCIRTEVPQPEVLRQQKTAS